MVSIFRRNSRSSEQYWNIFSVKAAGSDKFLADALAYISGNSIEKMEKLFPQTICPKCVVDINTVFKPLHELKTTIQKTDQNWKAFRKERLKQDQNKSDQQEVSYQITEYVVEEDNNDEEPEPEPEMDAVAFLLSNMQKGTTVNNEDDDDDDDDLGMSFENEAPPELEEEGEMIVPDMPERDEPTIFTIIDGPTERTIKRENTLLVAPPSPPPARKPYERRPKSDEQVIKYEERRHVCEVCQKRFLKKSNLIDHLRLHANMKIFKCDYCDRSFVQMGNYKQHLRIHTDEKPFTCEFCNKSYTQSSALKIHKRTHTGKGLGFPTSLADFHFLQF
jgi:Zinc finger, C2H2 type